MHQWGNIIYRTAKTRNKSGKKYRNANYQGWKYSRRERKYNTKMKRIDFKPTKNGIYTRGSKWTSWRSYTKHQYGELEKGKMKQGHSGSNKMNDKGFGRSWRKKRYIYCGNRCGVQKMVILHKQKEDVLSCKNFRSMKILDHVFNIMERVTEGRLRDHK